jgi:GTP-binding protein HflX
LSDTVGFIRKLPHHLVECFKSTLDEVREADILIHVVDVSHPNFEDQIGVVNETLKDLDARDKEIIMVFNKIDAYVSPEVQEEGEEKRPFTLEDFKKSWMAQHNDPTLFISALHKENLEELKQLLYDKIVVLHTQRYPFDKLLY